MFRLIGILLSIYILHCLTTGAVFAKSGPWGRTYRRDEQAFGYWSAIGCYVLLAVALIFYF